MLFVLEIFGFTLGSLGKLMVAYTAIKVHYAFWKEKKMDDIVVAEMKRERLAGIVGIIFIVVGYFLELPGRVIL